MLDTLELGRAEALLGAPLVEGDIRDADARRAGLQRPRRHGDRPLRRLQVRRRVDAVAGQVLAQQRRRHGHASSRRRCGPACATSCSRRRARCTARPTEVPVVETRADPARERVRRDQGDGRAGPALVRRHARAALGQPALLQRRRRQPRRRDRRGLDVLDQPRPARDEGRARRRAAGQGVRRRLPDARRHRASATTSTSRTSPTPTSRRSTSSARAADGAQRWPSTSAPASARRSST